MPEKKPDHPFPIPRPTDHAQHHAGAVFLHADRDGIHIQCPGGEQSFRRKGDVLRAHVVQIAGQKRDAVLPSVRLTQQHAHTVCPFKILFSHAVSDSLNGCNRHFSVTVDEAFEQRRAGGRAQLSPDASAIDGNALQDLGRRGSRDRQDTVRAAHFAAADMDRRREHLVRRKELHHSTDGHDIRDRIQRADLVKMDVRYRDSVDPALRLRQKPIHGQRVLPAFAGETESGDEPLDVLHPPVGTLVRLIVRLLGLAVYPHKELRARDAALCRLYAVKAHVGDPQRVQLRQNRLRVRHQLQQSGSEHIARRAHSAIDIQSFHILFPQTGFAMRSI